MEDLRGEEGCAAMGNQGWDGLAIDQTEDEAWRSGASQKGRRRSAPR